MRVGDEFEWHRDDGTVQHETCAGYRGDEYCCAAGWPCAVIPVKSIRVTRQCTDTEHWMMVCRLALINGTDLRKTDARRYLMHSCCITHDEFGKDVRRHVAYIGTQYAKLLHDVMGEQPSLLAMLQSVEILRDAINHLSGNLQEHTTRIAQELLDRCQKKQENDNAKH